ncbi:MAG: ROK family protein [Caldilineaceae bacterium]|nr:ROK family protein [Caldilineaceae bacterium]
MNHKIGQPELLKEINRSRAFEILKRTRILSRPELAQQTGLSRATIALLMDDLLRVGVAQHVGLGDSTGGRPPALLEFNPNAAFALGAAMLDHEWRIVLTNLDAQVVHRLDAPIPGSNPESAVEALQIGVQAALGRIERGRLLPAIGLGTPGLVDMPSGVIKAAVDVGWYEVPIRAMTEAALGLQCLVANRSKVGALAEHWYGASKGLEELIYISIGTGVAAGIVHAGELFMGVNSSAGELGHVTVLPDGPPCRCGNRGCLQQLVSEPAIADRARTRLREQPNSQLWTLVGHHPERVTAALVFAAAEQGDELANEIVDETARYLGIAIANLVNLFNPARIVLGGPVGQLSKGMLPLVLDEVRKRALSYPLSAVQIAPSSLGPDANAIGAAALVLRRASELIFAEK